MASKLSCSELVVIVENGGVQVKRRSPVLGADSAPTAKQYLLAHERGAYTTCRTIAHTNILLLSTHITRLSQSICVIRSDLIGPESPPENRALFTPEALRAPVLHTIQLGLRAWFHALGKAPASTSTKTEDDIRIYILLSVEEQAGTLRPVIFTFMEPLTPLGPSLATTGCIVEVPGAPPRHHASAKDSGWVRDRLPLEQNKTPDAEEVLLQTEEGAITEGLSSNFFVVMRNGHLRTANEGVLSGTVRQIVLHACEHKKIPVDFRPPVLSERADWAEAFITSTSRLVMPVRLIRVLASSQLAEPYEIVFPSNGPVVPQLSELISQIQRVWSLEENNMITEGQHKPKDRLGGGQHKIGGVSESSTRMTLTFDFSAAQIPFVGIWGSVVPTLTLCNIPPEVHPACRSRSC
ncbi:putative Aminotransferase; class IV [Paratrimastix pyriformis]|uniref:Aminotransferase n=1 Tax=Paratrimastix pyriformis TaxID=342808 RepID=A0ABQ8UH07_9EUKA|nr:putative Aminotransferase; class IV [Paratrimastix pyriformis]